MYCTKCGNRLIKVENYCSKCGGAVNKINTNDVNENDIIKSDGVKSASVVLGIVGIISSILIIFAPFALVFSIIGLVLGIKVNKRTRNVLGIVINSIALFFSSIISLLIVFGLYFSFHIIDDLWHEDTHYKEEIYYNEYDF